jgi:hypothetical protein
MQVPLNRENAFVGAGMVVGAGLGALAYFLTKKKYEKIANQEIAEFKAEYARVHEAKLDSQASARLNDMAKMDIILTDSGYIPKDAVDTLRETETSPNNLKDAIEANRNIFRDNAEVDTWDQRAEEAERDPDKPYIITQEEYHACELGFEQVNLTYFEGDDTLLEDDNEPITDIEDTVGEDNLLKFGHGSHDNKVVYVRNEVFQKDFEITHSEHKYTEDVLGFIQHSDKPPIRRMRQDY